MCRRQRVKVIAWKVRLHGTLRERHSQPAEVFATATCDSNLIMVSGEISPSATESTRLPIRGRLIAMAALAAIGSVTFLPFLAAGNHQSIVSLTPFALVVTLVSTVIAWPGLRSADAAGLPMPLLRRLDGHAARGIARGAFAVTFAISAALGILGLLALRLANAPALPGGAFARALSALFAAGPLEIVLHLGVMSIVVWLARGRRPVGIVAAAACLVLFHLTGGALAQPGWLVTMTVIGNGIIGLALGWIYAAYGFECVIVGHAVAHLITVLGGP